MLFIIKFTLSFSEFVLILFFNEQINLNQGFPKGCESPPGGDFSQLGGENLQRGERGGGDKNLKFLAVKLY